MGHADEAKTRKPRKKAETKKKSCKIKPKSVGLIATHETKA
jgi:hypothetical protein